MGSERYARHLCARRQSLHRSGERCGWCAGFGCSLTDVSPKKTEPRLTDSQKFIRSEEEKLIEYLRRQKEQKARAEEKNKKDKLPVFELQERQTALDLSVSPDEAHVFIIVGERAAGAKNTIVPSYVTESGYTEDIPARSNVGDAQDRRLLAILNLKTGKSVWADGSFAPPVTEPEQRKPESTEKAGGEPAAPGRKAEREIRWSMPIVSADGRHVVASARVGRQQGSLDCFARSGERQNQGPRHAARRSMGPGDRVRRRVAGVSPR